MLHCLFLLANNLLGTSMFSDVQKSNRRDCAKETNDLNGLAANLIEHIFYDAARVAGQDWEAAVLRLVPPNSGWDPASDEVREEYYFAKGSIIVLGKLVTRGMAKS